MKSYISAFALMVLSFKVVAANYYIDSKTGDDSNSGLNKASAWASLDKVNSTTFKSGDKILFKSGSQYSGQLELNDSGTAEAAITIDQYGKGAKPRIDGGGEKQHTLLIRNVEHWHINNLEITNQGEAEEASRTGVLFAAENSGELENITLQSLEIHHVNGSLIKEDGGGFAILARTISDKTPSRFNNVKIIDNYIHHTQRNGIIFGGNYSRDHWYPHLNLVIKNNLMEQVPGDGIVVIGAQGALIEGNLLRDFPDILPHSEAAAGIWPWSSDDTLIQYNEVSGHKAKWDGQGFDSDFNSSGTIIQHNYSHDNYGGFLLICNNGFTYQQSGNKGTLDTIIRHNVSVNDGLRPYPTEREGIFSPIFHITGPTENTKIHDNIIIVPSKPEGVDNTLVQFDDWGKKWPMSTLFENNQFYLQSPSKIDLREVTEVSFISNRFTKPVEGASISEEQFKSGEKFDVEALVKKAIDQKL